MKKTARSTRREIKLQVMDSMHIKFTQRYYAVLQGDEIIHICGISQVANRLDMKYIQT